MNLLDYICCPCCKEGLRNDVSYLSCDACLSRYPVVEGVPNFVDQETINAQQKYQRKFSNWKMQRIYYTSHTIKVFKVVINILFPVFDLQQIEKDDARLENEKWMASNIICFLSRVPS